MLFIQVHLPQNAIKDVYMRKKVWSGSWTLQEQLRRKSRLFRSPGQTSKGKKHIENIILPWKLCATLIRSLLWQHTVKWAADCTCMKPPQSATLDTFTVWLLSCPSSMVSLVVFMQKHLVHTHLATGFWKPQPGRRTSSNSVLALGILCVFRHCWICFKIFPSRFCK